MNLPGDLVVVEASGELDFYTSPDFQTCLRHALEGPACRVIVDLTQVTFIDSSALGILVGAARRAATQTTELMIVCPAGNVARVIAITGLTRVFAMYPTREDALRRRPDDQPQ